MIEVLVLIVLGSKEGLGESGHNAQTHQSICCSHIQSMDEDEDSNQVIRYLTLLDYKVFKRGLTISKSCVLLNK